MNKCVAYILIALGIVAVNIQATTFTIRNNAPKLVEVSPVWDGRPDTYDGLTNGQEKFYDSGLSQVTAIRWREVTSQENGVICFKRFERRIQSKVATLNNKFEIFENGGFKSDFLWGEHESGRVDPIK